MAKRKKAKTPTLREQVAELVGTVRILVQEREQRNREIELETRKAEIRRRRDELEKRYRREQVERFRDLERAHADRLRQVRDEAHGLGGDLERYLSMCDNPNPPKYVKLLRRALALIREQNELRRSSYRLFERRRALRNA